MIYSLKPVFIKKVWDGIMRLIKAIMLTTMIITIIIDVAIIAVVTMVMILLPLLQ